jgi:hypothetical protein
MDKITPEMDEKTREMIMQKTPEERIQMGCERFAEFRQSIIQDILRENPDISDSALRQEFFSKVYGHEYTKEELQKILDGLGKIQTPFKR